MSRTALINLGLMIAGGAYVLFVFVQNISSPLIALLLVMATTYRLVDSHRERNKP